MPVTRLPLVRRSLHVVHDNSLLGSDLWTRRDPFKLAHLMIGGARPVRQVTTKSRSFHLASIPASQGAEVLKQQRLKRPVAPHLMIYRPQITSVPSITSRITGLILSGTFYVFGASYFVAPALGWHISTETMVAAFQNLPIAMQYGLKSMLAWPLVFHSFHGLRHISWDFCVGITNKTVARTGWIAVIASFAAAGYLVMQ